MVRRTKGFTLIEVMAALMIFALGALAALVVATEQIASTSYLEERYFAQIVASNRLAEVQAGAPDADWPPRHEETGEAEMVGRQWYWDQQVLETVTADLREVTVRVRLREDGPILAEVSGFVGRR
ncbi:MAG: type II secretion system minor pseudopilin GspI [Idiomarina sp.]|nr:type II secretion system minor pseudopilin GspI [Idiomarina sp.]